MTRRGSAMVGDTPAAWARDRNEPSSRTRSASAVTAAGSEMSQATGTTPSICGASRSTATRCSVVPRNRSTHSRPMPLAAPVTTATVMLCLRSHCRERQVLQGRPRRLTQLEPIARRMCRVSLLHWSRPLVEETLRIRVRSC